MSVQIPAAVNYPSPLVALPTRWDDRAPPEGTMMVPMEILWASMGGVNHSVNVNLQNNAALNFSRICALSVDNSNCGADVIFVFTDTQQSYTIPAYSPSTVIPVFTNSTQFFVIAPNADVEDITRLSLHNKLPPPVAVPITRDQETAVFNDVPVANGDTVLLPAGVYGTLELATVFFQFVSTAVNCQFTLVDGSGTVLCGGQAGASPISNDNIAVMAMNVGPISVRFSNGLKLRQVITGDGTNAKIATNIFFRTP